MLTSVDIWARDCEIQVCPDCYRVLSSHAQKPMNAVPRLQLRCKTSEKPITMNVQDRLEACKGIALESHSLAGAIFNMHKRSVVDRTVDMKFWDHKKWRLSFRVDGQLVQDLSWCTFPESFPPFCPPFLSVFVEVRNEIVNGSKYAFCWRL